jgi:ketosteroid isomerase-like protein
MLVMRLRAEGFMRLPPLIFGFTLLLTSTAPVHGQASSPKGSPQEIRDDLIRIEREIGRANLECDFKYFDQIEADDFVFTDASGSLSTKKEDLAGEKDCRKFAGSYDLDQTEVRLYGNTAVVTSRVTIAGTGRDGKPVNRRSRFTDVFVWRDGRWQIVAGHSSRIVEAAK